MILGVSEIQVDPNSLFGIDPSTIIKEGDEVIAEVIAHNEKTGLLTVKLIHSEISAARRKTYAKLVSVPPTTLHEATVISANNGVYKIQLKSGLFATCAERNTKVPLNGQPLQYGDITQVRIISIDEKTDKIEVSMLPLASNSEQPPVIGDELKEFYLAIARKLKKISNAGDWIDGEVVSVHPFVGVYVNIRPASGGYPDVLGLLPASMMTADITTVPIGTHLRVVIDEVSLDLDIYRIKIILGLISPETYNETTTKIIHKIVTQDITPATKIDKSEIHNSVIVGVDRNVAFLRISTTGVIGILPIDELPDNVTARVVRVLVERSKRCNMLARSVSGNKASTEFIKFVLLTTKQDPSVLYNVSPERREMLTGGWYCGWKNTQQYHRETYEQLMEVFIYHRLGLKRYLKLMNLRKMSLRYNQLGLEYEMSDREGNPVVNLAEWVVDETKCHLLTPEYMKQYWEAVETNVKLLDRVDLDRVRQTLLEVKAELNMIDVDPNTEEGKLKRELNGEPIVDTDTIMKARHLTYEGMTSERTFDPIAKIDALIMQRNKDLGPEIVRYYGATKYYNEMQLPARPPSRYEMLLREYRGMMKRMGGDKIGSEIPKELPLDLQPGFARIKKYEDILRESLKGNEEQDCEYEEHHMDMEDLVGDNSTLRKMREEGRLVHGVPIPLPDFE